MAALTRRAIRQRVFTGSEVHHHARAIEFDAFRFRVAARNFDRKNARAAGPPLHPLLWFASEASHGIVPAEANPCCLPIRAVAVAEALAVVVVEREGAVGAGMDAEGRRPGHGLSRGLAHRSARH